jgi:hypothetical protein
MTLLFLLECRKTTPVFFALPRSQPFCCFSCHAFCPPAQRHIPALFLDILFFKVKTNREKPPPQTQKDTPGKTTLSYINIMRYYASSLAAGATQGCYIIALC